MLLCCWGRILQQASFCFFQLTWITCAILKHTKCCGCVTQKGAPVCRCLLQTTVRHLHDTVVWNVEVALYYTALQRHAASFCLTCVCRHKRNKSGETHFEYLSPVQTGCPMSRFTLADRNYSTKYNKQLPYPRKAAAEVRRERWSVTSLQIIRRQVADRSPHSMVRTLTGFRPSVPSTNRLEWQEQQISN